MATPAHQPARIYLDHAATTPLDPAVLEAMRASFWMDFGNPSSIHGSGRRARGAVDAGREAIAGVLGAAPHEVIFTGSGTEANNLAVLGVARAAAARGRHVVVSAIEHHAVLLAARSLRSEGFEVTELPVDQYGLVDPAEFGAALRPDTVLASIGLANNEIGTVQDIPALAEIARQSGVAFHTDAVQAAGQLDISIAKLGVDLLSLAAHKFYGPKGVGVLYVREGVPIAPIALGGAQELDRRSGTENVPGIVGLAAALARAQDARAERRRHYAALSRTLIDGVRARVADVLLTGHPTRRLPSFASFAFGDVDGESLVINLDLAGIDASTGAACTTGSLEPSHVIEALVLGDRYVRGSLRCTVGISNTHEQIEAFLTVIPDAVARLRDLAVSRDPAPPK